MGYLLDIENFSLSFNGIHGKVDAVKNVNLKVSEGEIVALVGESGSGKTALCRAVLKLHSDHAVVESGSILLGGSNLCQLSDAEMEDVRGKDVSMVFQNPETSLNPVFSVGSQIVEAIRLHDKISAGEAKARGLKLLAEMGIDNPEKRFRQYPHQLSGGMRQRVAIAIAMACNPKLLIADEPTTALDVDTQENIIKLLRRINEEQHQAILFVTHDLGVAEKLAQRIAVMKGGVIVEAGETEKIFNNPHDPYTRKLLGYVNYGKGRGHMHGRTHFHDGVAHSHPLEHEEPLIEVKNVSRSFELSGKNYRRVLEDFSMTVNRGEILGIIGPSGCGKSTLARCIMGIEKINEGSIDTKNVRNMQMIFQDSASAFNSRMTIEQIIAEPLVIGKERMSREQLREKVKKAMEQVKLDESLMKRHPYDVSGGQRQRAAIARAIITDPDFIIADEPISSLDVSIQAEIIHLLRELHDENGLTIMLISHDLPMVAHVSDRIIEMPLP